MAKKAGEPTRCTGSTSTCCSRSRSATSPSPTSGCCATRCAATRELLPELRRDRGDLAHRPAAARRPAAGRALRAGHLGPGGGEPPAHRPRRLAQALAAGIEPRHVAPLRQARSRYARRAGLASRRTAGTRRSRRRGRRARRRDRRRLVVERTGAGCICSADLLDVGLAEAHAEAAADDHRLEVEQVDRRGDPGPERLRAPGRSAPRPARRSARSARSQTLEVSRSRAALLHDLEQVRLHPVVVLAARLRLHRRRGPRRPPCSRAVRTGSARRRARRPCGRSRPRPRDRSSACRRGSGRRRPRCPRRRRASSRTACRRRA